MLRLLLAASLLGSGSCACASLAEGFAPDDLDDAGSACAAAANWTAPLNLRFGRRCELHPVKLTPTCTFGVAERRALGCPCGSLDGLLVKYGRSRAQDYDLYDFKPRCAGREGQWARLTFRAKERFASASLACADGEPITGLEVTYARYEWGDVDQYDFRLRCARAWQAAGTALHAETRRRRPSSVHTAAVECAPGTAACGLEVTRARQEDGDVDLLDFRLRCHPAGEGGEAAAGAGTEAGEAGARAGGEVEADDSSEVAEPAVLPGGAEPEGVHQAEASPAASGDAADADAAPRDEL